MLKKILTMVIVLAAMGSTTMSSVIARTIIVKHGHPHHFERHKTVIIKR